MKDDFELVHGSGNVFRDFGRPNADLEQARAILAAKIIGVPDRRKLSARAAEKLTGVSHADLSRIRKALGQLSKRSVPSHDINPAACRPFRKQAF